jgi:adenine-specific DNA-methyltransferase
MIDVRQPTEWGHTLGLAVGRLFSAADAPAIGEHKLLLNGADGCVAFSSFDENIEEQPFRDWAWSSGVLHHLSASRDRIVIRRWDSPHEHRSYNPSSVATQVREFYRMLVKERPRTPTTLDQHAVDVFRRLRSNHPPERAIAMFLFLLAAMVEGTDDRALDQADEIICRHGIDDITAKDVQQPGIQFWRDSASRFRSPAFAQGGLTTLPSLVIRHAGSRIFQEAHFELLRAGDPDLFNYAAPALVNVTTRGGVHFTPPGIARALTEQAAGRVPERELITILDPACGSGAFLVEAARYFQARNAGVRLRLIGFDISPFAAAMARFALTQLQRDWEGSDIESEIHVRDALADEPWPQCDLILTNPPFVAWPDLTSSQQHRVHDLVKGGSKSAPQRPDLSMAFVTRGLGCLGPEGVLGSLLPGGVLAMDTATPWRTLLLDRAQLNFVALLGEHGLFQYATVEVAAVVLSRGTKPVDCVFVWSGQRRGASAEALRELRRQGLNVERAADDGNGDWSIYRRSPEQTTSEPSWRPRPYRLEAALEQILKTVRTKVGDLFHIRQGVRTGHREAFLINHSVLKELPEEEQIFFRPVIENDNIRDGKIDPGLWIFYPDTPGLPPIDTSEDLARITPKFFERLLKYRPVLVRRKGARNWWNLTRPRSWLRAPQPKLVSAYFGQSGSFSFDRKGDGVIVQGHGWITRGEAFDRVLRDVVVHTDHHSVRVLQYEKQVAPAYVALLNSGFFETLLREFCPTVGGGQCNLSAIFVNRIPLPNLAVLARPGSQFERHVRELARVGNEILDGEYKEGRILDEIVEDVYNL